MAKRIDYDGIVGLVYTNKKGQRYKVTEYKKQDGKHLYNVVWLDAQLKSYKTVVNGTVKFTPVTKERAQEIKLEPPVSYKRIANLKQKVVLAIDCATLTTGMALYRPNKGIHAKQITASGITGERIEQMRDKIKADLINHKVEVVYYEQPLLKNHTATFTLGALLTEIKEMVQSLGMEFIQIKPSSWQAYHGFKGERTERKKNSIIKAERELKRTCGEDEADAYNMLTYCLDRLEG